MKPGSSFCCQSAFFLFVFRGGFFRLFGRDPFRGIEKASERGNIQCYLIDYIGADKFNAWVHDESYTKERNIQSCIEYFGLTKEDLTEALDPPETDDTGFDLTVS